MKSIHSFKAGMILNCAVFGAMFRPLEAKKTSSNRAAVAMDDICEMAAVTPLMVRVRRDEDVVKNGNGASVNGNSINRSSEHRYPSISVFLSSNALSLNLWINIISSPLSWLKQVINQLFGGG